MTKPTGRPRGRPPKKVDPWENLDPQDQLQAQEFTESFVATRVKDYLDILDGMARNTAIEPIDRRMAIQTLLERGLGKPGVPEKQSSLQDLKDVLKAFIQVNQSAKERAFAEGHDSLHERRLAPVEGAPTGTFAGRPALASGDSGHEGAEAEGTIPDASAAGAADS